MTHENREGCDGIRHSAKQCEMNKTGMGRVYEVLINRDCHCETNPKGEKNSPNRNSDGASGIAFNDFKVNFQTDEEEEHDKPNRSCEVQIREGCLGEDMICESWDTPHRGRPKKNSGSRLNSGTLVSLVEELTHI